jgi:hypothetical protein
MAFARNALPDLKPYIDTITQCQDILQHSRNQSVVDPTTGGDLPNTAPAEPPLLLPGSPLTIRNETTDLDIPNETQSLSNLQSECTALSRDLRSRETNLSDSKDFTGYADSLRDCFRSGRANLLDDKRAEVQAILETFRGNISALENLCADRPLPLNDAEEDLRMFASGFRASVEARVWKP